jgi:hypothetical protein
MLLPLVAIENGKAVHVVPPFKNTLHTPNRLNWRSRLRPDMNRAPTVPNIHARSLAVRIIACELPD